MAALLDRRVLGVQAERVVAHRPQDRVALASTHVREDIAEGVVEDVPHVELAGGIRQHLEDVGGATLARGARLGVRDRERALGRPHGLPLGLDRLGVVPVGVGRLHLHLSETLPGTKKPLDREAQGSSRGGCRVLSLDYVRSCCTSPMLTGTIARC